ncbi:Dolichyl-phosphate-mannose-protein mannosyltransferase-domain-containing protein [Lipomyces japonicus]|uniref:Dolichyl-phosphate-mannose-protein mannosyltransferase-domain-containing protein n=1 Tax=Lipomyces japonicus TaxID=56871 RepID=UPI0034CDE78F
MADKKTKDSLKSAVADSKKKAASNASPPLADISQPGIVTLPQPSPSQASSEARKFNLVLALSTIAAFVTRFYILYHPDQVVFDEVHFGKFASYYLQRTFFFDVHPPFGKLLFAFIGWLVGYDGAFLFDNIGDGYSSNKVPYLAYRALPATLGALTVPVVFLTMKHSGYSLAATSVATALVLFDNSHVTQTRLILLDATLIFSMACALYSYVRFSQYRNRPFTFAWWKWLLLTGFALSCTISTKYVGAFTFFTVGLPVVLDLWNLLDYQTGLTLRQFGHHFLARVFGLILFPFAWFLFWFYVHFAVLSKSGPGDDFMSAEFQETLGDNQLLLSAKQINYYDFITFQHKDTKAFLHSHFDHYPLRYEDGRISSQGQQVTAYPFHDVNNAWMILPAVGFADNDRADHAVRGGDLVQLYHNVTQSFLLSHDVASPFYPTNQEFTTVSEEDALGSRYNDTLFEIRLNNNKRGDIFRTKASPFKLIHNPSKVAMWTHDDKPLPEWGFKQQEVNGNKNAQQPSNTWIVDEIVNLTGDRALVKPKLVKKLPFIKKYLELQIAMFRHNNALTSSHPYMSHPPEWPFMLRGVSFWTDNGARQQIYLVGNPIGWWLATSSLAVLAGLLVADQLTRRRRNFVLAENVRARLYNSAGFFLWAWAAHYLPFYTMGRQLFLHHYLPAHLASALAAGAVLDFFYTSPGAFHVVLRRQPAPSATHATEPIKVYPPSSRWSWLVSGVIISVLIAVFKFFAPFTYGSPGLDVQQVVDRKWLNFDLHFAK